MKRALARVVACLAAPLLLFLAVLSFGEPMSISFWLGMLVLLGFAAGPWIPGRAGKVVLRCAIGLLVLTVGTTLVLSGRSEGRSFLQEARLPSAEPLGRWTSLFPERDSAMLATPFVTTDDERVGLRAALDAVYQELEEDGTLRRTTQLRTVFDQHSEGSSDAHMHREGAGAKWVIFLHGLGGNTASGCWVIARAAARSGWSTLCPSTSMDGRWGQEDGPAILREAVAHSRTQGTERLVLAGYSNGASGALQILDDEYPQDFEALILVSGYRPSVAAESLRLRTLVLSGEADERCHAWT